MTLLKEFKAEAKDLGKAARASNKRAIPAYDKELQDLLSLVEKSTWRQGIMKMWLSGWHTQNINYSI